MNELFVKNEAISVVWNFLESREKRTAIDRLYSCFLCNQNLQSESLFRIPTHKRKEKSNENKKYQLKK